MRRRWDVKGISGRVREGCGGRGRVVGCGDERGFSIVGKADGM